MVRSFLSALLLLSALELSAGVSPLPIAPDGFKWQWIANIQGAFLVPSGWVFHDESNASDGNDESGNSSFTYLIRSASDQHAQLLVKVLTDASQMDNLKPSVYAERVVSDYEEAPEVMDVHRPQDMEDGKLKVFSIRHINRSLGESRIQRVTLVANDTTGTLYLLKTNCLASNWSALDQLDQMATKFYLDDEI